MLGLKNKIINWKWNLNLQVKIITDLNKNIMKLQ